MEVTYFLPKQFRSIVEAAGARWRPLARPYEVTEAPGRRNEWCSWMCSAQGWFCGRTHQGKLPYKVN